MPTPRRSPPRSPGWCGCAAASRAVPCRPLQRSVQGCKEAHLPLWQPVASSLLGLALVMLDALDEALPLLEEAVSRTGELGVKAYLRAVEDAPCRGLAGGGAEGARQGARRGGAGAGDRTPGARASGLGAQDLRRSGGAGRRGRAWKRPRPTSPRP